MDYPIPDLPDYYVTEEGLVISKKHNKRQILKVLVKYRKSEKSRSGKRPTYQICFTKKLEGGGYQKITKQLHQVVCAAKEGRWPAAWEEVRHLDSDYTNNVMSNLAYGDHLSNILDDIENGTRGTSAEYIEMAIQRLQALQIRLS